MLTLANLITSLFFFLASAANVANDGKHPLLEFAMRYFREGKEKFDMPEDNQNGSLSKGKSNL